MAETAKQSLLEIVVPVVDYQDVMQSVSARPPRPRSVRGKTIALLPNFRVISPPFMEALAQRLGKGTGVKRAFMHNVPEWQFNHPERVGRIGPEVDRFSRECDLVVSGIGD